MQPIALNRASLSRLWLLLVLLLIPALHLSAQHTRRLDAENGLEDLKLGTDLSTGYYLGDYISERNYYVRKKEPLKHYCDAEVLGVRYYTKRYLLGEIVLFIDHKYDQVVKKRLFARYGKPTEFHLQDNGRATASWVGDKVTLFVNFSYQSDDLEDLQYDGEIVVYITSNAYSRQSMIERVSELK